MRKALTLALVIVFLIIITYLLSVLFLRVLPAPFGTLEDFFCLLWQIGA